MKDVVVPSVAELPIRHATPHGLPPLIRSTDDALAVVSVLAVLKMKMALAFPCAFNLRVPVNWCRRVKAVNPRRERQATKVLPRQIGGACGVRVSALY